MFLYAYGAAFAFSISTLRRNLFVSPPLTPLSPRGERGKPITIFLLDISLPRNYNKFAGHTIAYVDNVIPTGYGSALSIKNPPAFAGGFFICFYCQLYKMGRYCAIRSYFAKDTKQFILYNCRWLFPTRKPYFIEYLAVARFSLHSKICKLKLNSIELTPTITKIQYHDMTCQDFFFDKISAIA